jgi:hypothetical protein
MNQAMLDLAAPDSMQPSLSVVTPCYDEVDVLPAFCRRRFRRGSIQMR